VTTSPFRDCLKTMEVAERSLPEPPFRDERATGEQFGAQLSRAPRCPGQPAGEPGARPMRQADGAPGSFTVNCPVEERHSTTAPPRHG